MNSHPEKNHSAVNHHDGRNTLQENTQGTESRMQTGLCRGSTEFSSSHTTCPRPSIWPWLLHQCLGLGKDSLWNPPQDRPQHPCTGRRSGTTDHRGTVASAPAVPTINAPNKAHPSSLNTHFQPSTCTLDELTRRPCAQHLSPFSQSDGLQMHCCRSKMCDHPRPYGESYKFHAQNQLLRTFKYLNVKEKMEITNIEGTSLLALCRKTVLSSWNRHVHRPRDEDAKQNKRDYRSIL